MWFSLYRASSSYSQHLHETPLTKDSRMLASLGLVIDNFACFKLNTSLVVRSLLLYLEQLQNTPIFFRFHRLVLNFLELLLL